jgi:hypothetical protein
MRQCVKAIALAAENAGVSPFLPLAAGMIIMLFAVTLAAAEPRTTEPVMAAHDTVLGYWFDRDGGLASDAIPPDDAAILSQPLSPPSYHDRYRFYHRYDHELRARFNPIDGVR